MGHKYPVNAYVALTEKGAYQLKKKFGTVSGHDQAWVITAHTSSAFFSTYTIMSATGSKWEGVKEEHIALIPEPEEEEEEEEEGEEEEKGNANRRR